jgi:hypothetical protein
MLLPKIIKDRVDLEISPQMILSLFPDEGQPKIDVIKISLTQIEGEKLEVFMTPCEALELASGINQIVQFYLYNQEQYRKEILEPRLKLAEKRSKKKKKLKKWLYKTNFRYSIS